MKLFLRLSWSITLVVALVLLAQTAAAEDVETKCVEPNAGLIATLTESQAALRSKVSQRRDAGRERERVRDFVTALLGLLQAASDKCGPQDFTVAEDESPADAR